MRELKEELKDKERKNRKLRDQLAEADVDTEEWRCAYERISESGQKKRKK